MRPSSTPLLLAPLLLLATGCLESDLDNSACGASTSSLTETVPGTWAMDLAGALDGDNIMGSDPGWFNFNGDVTVSLGNELNEEEPFIALAGLVDAEGGQCAEGARFEMFGETWINGANPDEGYEATLDTPPFSVEITSYIPDEEVQGHFSGTFEETWTGGEADEPLDVSGTFHIDLSSGL